MDFQTCYQESHLIVTKGTIVQEGITDQWDAYMVHILAYSAGSVSSIPTTTGWKSRNDEMISTDCLEISTCLLLHT